MHHGARVGRQGVGLHELRDAEVEHLHLARGEYDHVAGFDVAMQHQPLVCVVHRGTDLAEQPDSFGDRQPLLGAVRGEGRAFGQLHHEVAAPGGHAAIHEPHDVGMVEAGEDLAFLDEASLRFGREDEVAGHLEGQLPRQLAIRTLRAVDRAHATAAQFSQQAIRAHHGSGLERPTLVAAKKRRRRLERCQQ